MQKGSGCIYSWFLVLFLFSLFYIYCCSHSNWISMYVDGFLVVFLFNLFLFYLYIFDSYNK